MQEKTKLSMPVRLFIRRWDLKTLRYGISGRRPRLPVQPSIIIFRQKKKLFLALLQREHEAWISNLEEITREHETMTIGDFSDAIAGSLEKRGCMLKLMSMNLYDMEGNSRMDNLVAFKVVYAQALRSVSGCLEKFFPRMTPGDIQEYLYVFFPFLFGVYPYTTATDKQKEAMELAHVNYAQYSVYEIVRSFVSRILQTFNKEHH